MNPYFENENKINAIQKDIEKYLSYIKILTKKQEELKDTCNHTNKDGSSAITRRNDRGHGHIIYTCGICGSWGSRSWASKFIDLF